MFHLPIYTQQLAAAMLTANIFITVDTTPTIAPVIGQTIASGLTAGTATVSAPATNFISSFLYRRNNVSVPGNTVVADGDTWQVEQKMSPDQGAAVTVFSNTVVVVRVNQEPVAVTDVAITDFNTQIVINVLDNDSDDFGALSIQSLNTGVTVGSPVITDSNTTITYTPAIDFSGSDSFQYTIVDVDGATDTGTVNITVNPDVSAVSATMAILGRSATLTAPEAVELEIQSLTGFTSEARHLEYYWDMDEPNTFTAPENVLSTYLNDDIRIGKRVCRVYQQGTRTPSCLVYDPASGQSVVVTLGSAIVTSDPDTFFPTTQTIYLDPSNNHPNAPAGATLITNSDLGSVVGLYILDANEPRRIMLARGETFTWSGEGFMGLGPTISTFHMVAAPGAGAKPILNMTGGTGWNDKSAASGGSTKDWVHQNIDIVGTYNSATNTGAEFTMFSTYQSPPNMFLFDDCDLSNAGQFINNTSNDPNVAHRRTILNNCVLDDWREYAFVSSTHFSDWLLGTAIKANVNALADSTVNGGAAYRCGGAHRFTGVYASDTYTRQGWSANGSIRAIQGNYRINTSGEDNSEAHFAGCSFEGGTDCLVFAVEGGEFAGDNCRYVIDKSYFLGCYTTWQFIAALMPVTVKDCVFEMPDVTQIAGVTGWTAFIQIPNDGQTAANRALPFEVYNNTFVSYQGSSVAKIANTGGVTTVIDNNNVVHEPNAANAVAGGITNGTKVITPREIGYRSSTFVLDSQGDKSTPNTFGFIPTLNTPQAKTAGLISNRTILNVQRMQGNETQGAV